MNYGGCFVVDGNYKMILGAEYEMYIEKRKEETLKEIIHKFNLCYDDIISIKWDVERDILVYHGYRYRCIIRTREKGNVVFQYEGYKTNAYYEEMGE